MAKLTRHRLLCFVALIWSNLLVLNAAAQTCSFTIDNLNFGGVDLSSGTTFRTTGNLTAVCSGIPGQRIRICPSIGSGSGGVAGGGDPRYMVNGANQLQYNIYRNAGYTNIWGSYFWGHPPLPPQPRLRLNAAGNGTRTRPIRAEIAAGQTTLPAVTYSSSFAGGHTLVAYAYNSVGNCNAIGTANAVQVPFTVTATNTASCTVSTTSLDFGTTSLLNSNIDNAATVSVTCPTGMSYSVGLNNGGTGSGPTNRLMLSGGEDIQYGIYQNSGRSIAWGNVIGTNTVSGVGTGSAQNLTAFGRVPPQTTPSAATYADTVIVTITY